eukprot:450205-Pelagomonas_calceolata.AAC.1
MIYPKDAHCGISKQRCIRREGNTISAPFIYLVPQNWQAYMPAGVVSQSMVYGLSVKWSSDTNYLTQIGSAYNQPRRGTHRISRGLRENNNLKL